LLLFSDLYHSKQLGNQWSRIDEPVGLVNFSSGVYHISLLPVEKWCIWSRKPNYQIELSHGMRVINIRDLAFDKQVKKGSKLVVYMNNLFLARKIIYILCRMFQLLTHVS